jgi:hypothetical protein
MNFAFPGPLTPMKTSPNLIIGVLALLTIGATTVAWQQYWKAARLEAATLSATAGADLQKRLDAAENQNRSLTAELDVRREAAAEAGAQPAANARNANQGGRGPRGDMAAIMDRPEMQRLRTLQQRAALDTRFAPLFKSLNLAPEKLSQFKNLLAERESTMQDVMMAARDQGVDPRSDPEGFRKLVTAAQAEINSQLKSVLGDDGYAQYEKYAQTQPQRATVEQLRQSLSYTSEPLTDTQASQLVQILAASSPAAQSGAQSDGAPPMPPEGGGGRGPGGLGGPPGGSGGAPITTETIAQAQTVLSTTQLSALQQMQALQQAQQQAMQLMRNAGDGAAPATGNAPTTSGRGTGRS